MWTLFMAMNGDPGGMQPLFDAYPGTLVFAVLALAWSNLIVFGFVFATSCRTVQLLLSHIVISPCSKSERVHLFYWSSWSSKAGYMIFTSFARIQKLFPGLFAMNQWTSMNCDFWGAIECMTSYYWGHSIRPYGCGLDLREHHNRVTGDVAQLLLNVTTIHTLVCQAKCIKTRG